MSRGGELSGERVIAVDRDWYVDLVQYLQADESFSEKGQRLNRVLFTASGKKLIFKTAFEKRGKPDVSAHGN
ncbi:MAG TPA: hypothetical protein VN976_22080 [Verrucomicrobiae bacterium]|nr:hypothetical protein [Verrucomicrobiae bacterium]